MPIMAIINGTRFAVQADPIGLRGGWNRFTYADVNPIKFADSRGLAQCFYDVVNGRLHCISEDPEKDSYAGDFTSGNNEVPGCKDNPDCKERSDIGPIPQGCYSWGEAGKPDGLNRRKLDPVPGRSTGHRGAFQTHCCSRNGEGNPFFYYSRCSRGCVVSYCSMIENLYDFLDSEEGGNTLCVY